MIYSASSFQFLSSLSDQDDASILCLFNKFCLFCLKQLMSFTDIIFSIQEVFEISMNVQLIFCLTLFFEVHAFQDKQLQIHP